MKKCITCNSCIKNIQIGNRQYKFCALCLRVWKMNGNILVEIFDDIIEGIEVKKEVVSFIKRYPL